MERPKIRQQVTFFYTNDLEMTTSFYENTIGFDLVLDQGKCRIFGISTTGFLGFCEKEDAFCSFNVIFTLVTNDVIDVDEWYKYLSGKNVPIEKRPSLNPEYNIYHFYFRDPNGYLIEIQKFLDEGWPSS